MKQKYECSSCKSKIMRYPSQVRNPNRVFCNKNCRAEYQKTELRGDKNPNWKHGKHVDPLCSCGAQKDYRSLSCATCAHVGKPVGWDNDYRTELEIRNAVAESESILEASGKLKVGRSWLSKQIALLEIDINHFKSCSSRPLSPEQLLVKGEKRKNGTVKAVLLRENLLQYNCSICGLGNSWQNKLLTLQLDHIDGDPYNNELSNLRFLCPNCHSQTPTFTGRNSRIR